MSKNMHAELIDLYRAAAENAFGWAEIHRQEEQPFIRDKPYTKEEAEVWLTKYMTGVPSTERFANQPGSPLHLIGLAFRDMTISAAEWDAWGYRLTAAHDRLSLPIYQQSLCQIEWRIEKC